MSLRLVHTPRSHFARKVRLLLDGLGIAHVLVDAVDAGSAEAGVFGPNPLMKVPTLLDGDIAVFDSDHIAAHLVRTRDPADRFGVLTADVDVLNARAVLNGAMAAEVELVLAARGGLDTAHPRFDKMRAAIAQALDWLHARADVFPVQPSYLGFHLVAFWDHVALYGLADLRSPRLREVVERLSALDSVARSRPT